MKPPAIAVFVLGLLAVHAGAQAPATVPAEPTRVIPPATDASDAALAKIDALVRSARFDDAAEQAAALLDDPAPRLASRSGWNHRDWSLIDVRREVERRMAAWPDEARAAYQQHQRLDAALAFERAGNDAVQLRAAVDRFLFADAALACGLRLVALDWRDGRFVQAARTARRLLLRPMPPSDHAQVLVELAFAEAMAGRRAPAERAIRQLRAEHATGSVTLGGRRVRVADLTTDSLPAPPRAATARGTSSTLHDDCRNGMAVDSGMPTAIAWRATLPPLPEVGRTEHDRRRIGAWLKTISARGALLVGNAVPGDDRVLVNRGHELLALLLEDGATPAEWKQTHPPDGVLRGRMPESARWIARMGFSRAVAPFFAIVADSRQAVAITGTEDHLPSDSAQPPREQQRVWCIDLSSGRVAWSRASAELLAGLVPDGCYLGGSIAMDDEQVFALVRGPLRSPTQSAWLACLAREDGVVRWLTPLGSALLMGTRLAVPEFEASYVAHLAVADGRVFVADNLGSIAAVEIDTGRVAWLSGYPHRLFAPSLKSDAHLLPFNSSPTIVSQGAVFSMPIDGTHLLVHDAETGEPLRVLSREQLGNPTVLLGVRDDHVLLAGERDAWSVRWRDDDALAPAPKPTWRTTTPPRRGRALLSANRMYLPTAEGVRVLELRDGSTANDAPAALLRGLPPGNLFLHEARLLVIVGDTEVVACRLADPGSPRR